jgi:hypothetical protein
MFFDGDENFFRGFYSATCLLGSPIPHPTFPKQAGDGNRTHVASLEGWGFTIKLHPRGSKLELKRPKLNSNNTASNDADQPTSTIQFAQPKPKPFGFQNSNLFRHSNLELYSVGGKGFEPLKAMPPDLQSGPFDRSGNPPRFCCDSVSLASSRQLTTS